MARTVQASAPSSTPISTTFVQPPPSPPPFTNLISSSYQPTDESKPLQRAEFHQSLALLQEEIHQSIDSLNHNQETFQSHITAQLAALQSTIVQAITGQHQPIHTSTPSTPSAALSFTLPPPPPQSPANIPPITFGSLSSPTPTPAGPASNTQLPAIHTYSHHTVAPTAAPPQYTTIASLSQPPPPHLTLPEFHIPCPQTTNFHRFQQPNKFHTNNHNFKPPKIDLPRFTGDDAVGWLAMAERYLRTQRIPASERVSTVACHFGPEVSIWMNSFEQRNPYISWEQFVPTFLAQFGPGSSAEFKALLAHLQQTTTVEHFISVFTKLSCRAPDWTDAQLLPIFIGGLKPKIRHDVMAFAPATLKEAQRLARRYEAKLTDSQVSEACPFRPYCPTNWSTSFRSTSGPDTTHSHPIPNRTTTTTNPTNPTNPTPTSYHSNQRPSLNRSPRVWATQAQRDRRAKGLCFNCDEQYSPTHVCKRPFLAILAANSSMEAILAADSSMEDDSDNVEFHACVQPQDEPIPETVEVMKIRGTINGSPATIFIDCGAASNFLNPLSPRSYGPFLIQVRIGKFLHPIFHVSLLKRRIRDGTPLTTSLPDFDEHGDLLWRPEKVLDRAVVRKKKCNITQWLIQWVGLPAEDATWEEAHTIKHHFPPFCA